MANLTTFLPGDNGIIIFLGLICLGFIIGVLSGMFKVGFTPISGRENYFAL